MVLRMDIFRKLMALFLFFLALSFCLNIYLLFANRTLANNLESKEVRFNKLVSSMHVMVKQKNKYMSDINYIVSDINNTVEESNGLRSEIESLNKEANKLMQKIVLLDVNNTIRDLSLEEHTMVNAKDIELILKGALGYLDDSGYECEDDIESVTDCLQELSDAIQNDADSVSCGNDGQGHISCINSGEHPLLSSLFSLYADNKLKESRCLRDDIISPQEECRFMVHDCDRYEILYNGEEISAENCY
jgi:uncharacterized protein YkvS